MYELPAPSFADLSSKISRFIKRNKQMGEYKTWTSIVTIYGEYMRDLGWSLEQFRKEEYPYLYKSSLGKKI